MEAYFVTYMKHEFSKRSVEMSKVANRETLEK